ncbi:MULTISPECIES: helix-turn-helix transcriptional regulator [unclassified Pseudomonas]|uniref:helix-turn-helix domain-containing protein n=1 Tax=unclassified Pseudomonas TaxID=196821 RepID=UPI00244BFD8B|nr:MULTISPECIES: helix-turn-helix transcriptional regulator [unclassified Pseudomonas]MDH0897709.1 helix-turn-helix domain-containing protein [Pseudomonas sp. GD03875]MDH1067859.1 helix-turn-helix domain-containing protein [Pseudomonas sp. GD03985]
MMKLIHQSPKGETAMTLGENLRKLREAAGLSQGELAVLARLNLKLIQRMENGIGDTGVSKVKAVVIALGCTADQLLFDEDELGEDGDLRVLFQQLQKLQGKDRETSKEVIRALIMQHQNRELLKHG